MVHDRHPGSEKLARMLPKTSGHIDSIQSGFQSLLHDWDMRCFLTKRESLLSNFEMVSRHLPRTDGI